MADMGEENEKKERFPGLIDYFKSVGITDKNEIADLEDRLDRYSMFNHMRDLAENSRAPEMGLNYVEVNPDVSEYDWVWPDVFYRKEMIETLRQERDKIGKEINIDYPTLSLDDASSYVDKTKYARMSGPHLKAIEAESMGQDYMRLFGEYLSLRKDESNPHASYDYNFMEKEAFAINCCSFMEKQYEKTTGKSLFDVYNIGFTGIRRIIGEPIENDGFYADDLDYVSQGNPYRRMIFSRVYTNTDDAAPDFVTKNIDSEIDHWQNSVDLYDFAIDYYNGKNDGKSNNLKWEGNTDAHMNIMNIAPDIFEYEGREATVGFLEGQRDNAKKELDYFKQAKEIENPTPEQLYDIARRIDIDFMYRHSVDNCMKLTDKAAANPNFKSQWDKRFPVKKSKQNLKAMQEKLDSMTEEKGLSSIEDERVLDDALDEAYLDAHYFAHNEDAFDR